MYWLPYSSHTSHNPTQTLGLPWISNAAQNLMLNSCIFFSNLKQNFIAYRSSKVSSRPDCIFEMYQFWQSGFSSVHSNYCCSCPFEPKIIKISLSSYKMYSNNILNVQGSTTILNSCTKKSWNLLKAPPTSMLAIAKPERKKSRRYCYLGKYETSSLMKCLILLMQSMQMKTLDQSLFSECDTKPSDWQDPVLEL